MGGAVSFQGPYFHFSEALASELGFSAQRLLGDQGIRTYGSLMHLIFHHMVQFQHIFTSDRHSVFVFLSGFSVIQRNFTVFRVSGFFQLRPYLFFGYPVQSRSGHFMSQFLGGQAGMELQGLPKVHTRNNSQRR